VLLHAVVLSALFLVVERRALDGLVQDHSLSASLLLEEAETYFRETTARHQGEALHTLAARHGSLAGKFEISLLRPGSVSEPLPPPGRTAWTVVRDGGVVLEGVRALSNEPSCQSCHGSQAPVLGYLRVRADITPQIAAARKRLRVNFALITATWLLLFAGSIALKRAIIERPLRSIQEAVAAPGGQRTGKIQDLEQLAWSVQRTVWQLLQEAAEQRQKLAQGMARAEQLAALGEVAAGLSHEVRNPIAGVIASLEVLQEAQQLPPEQAAQVMQTAIATLRRVDATLASFLRLARPEPPQRRLVNLKEVAQEVVGLAEPRARREGIHLQLHLAPELPLLWVDPQQLAQLLLNLLTNALQACKKGDAVTVSMVPFPDGKGVVLTVADTGEGIAPEHVPRIFEPFFTTKPGGTGLGLAICHNIVSQHGGSISVRAAKGKGTEVVVVLPQQAPEERPSGVGPAR